MLLVSIIFCVAVLAALPATGPWCRGIINWRIYRMAGDVVLVIANTR